MGATKRGTWLGWFTPWRAVVAYFACFALVWLGVSAALWLPGAQGFPEPSSRVARVPVETAILTLALAVHAAVFAALAWKAPQRFAAHPLLATACAALPLVVLVAKLWLVPAFFYVIAALHVWLAVRQETLGRLQARHRPSSQARLG